MTTPNVSIGPGASSWRLQPAVCDGNDHYFVLDSLTPGSGPFPNVPFEITAVSLASFNTDPNGYLVVGVLYGNGDWISRYLIGPSVGKIEPLPVPYPYVPGEPAELHLHYATQSGNGNYVVTIFWNVTSLPA